jgi:cell volume regulation protein A
MQIVMFLTLGLLVFPSKIVPVLIPGLLLSTFLILVARPIAVFISLSFTRGLNVRKKLFISWVGLRGAAPIVFATFPLLAGIEYADTIFNLVFFISVSSVVLQGSTLPMVARWLHVSVPGNIKRKFPIDIELRDDQKSELVELDIPDDSPVLGKQVVQIGLPKTAHIVLIHRNGKYITATGETVIEGKDHLLVMGDNKQTVEEVNKAFGLKD